MRQFVKTLKLNIIFYEYILNTIIYISGRGERYRDISKNNVERATYMTDADTNSLDMVDSDTSFDLKDAIQHDVPAGSFKVIILINKNKKNK